MRTPVKKSIVLDPELDAKLMQVASERRESFSFVIRDVLAHFLDAWLAGATSELLDKDLEVAVTAVAERMGLSKNQLIARIVEENLDKYAKIAMERQHRLRSLTSDGQA